MADVVQELVVAIGLDASGLRGLDRAVASVGDAVGSSTAKVDAAAKKTADAMAKAGEVGRRAAEKIKDSWGSLTPVLNALKGGFAGLIAALAGAGAASKLFSNYIDQGDKLSNLSRELGISAREIDAWSKANAAAGGSAEALQGSLKAFYQSTGRPATEFFKLGEKIEGMSKRQADAFLRAQGVATDAIPIFLNGQKAAEELVQKYRKTAFTAQDARNASNFKTAWMDFRIAVQGVGNTFIRHLVPAMTKVIGTLEKMISYVQENIQFFTVMGGVMAAVFAVKNLEAIKAAALAVKAFGLSVKGALLPLTAIAAAILAAAMAFDDLLTFAQGGDSIFGRMLENLGMTSDEIEGIRKTLQGMGEAFGKAWDAVKPFLKGALQLALKGVAVLIIPIISLLAAVVAGLTKCAQWVADFGRSVADAFTDAYDALTECIDWLADFGQSVADAFTEAFDALTDFFGSIGEAIESAFDGVTDFIKGLFASWMNFAKSLFLDPIKNAIKGVFGGIKSFFGIKTESGEESVPREQQGVMEQRSKGAGNQITTNSSINVTNNIQTKDDPTAIGAAVGQSVQGGAGRLNDLTAQTMRGVSLK